MPKPIKRGKSRRLKRRGTNRMPKGTRHYQHQPRAPQPLPSFLPTGSGSLTNIMVTRDR